MSIEDSTGGEETRHLLADSAERLFADLCTPALLRVADRVHLPSGATAAVEASASVWQAIRAAGLDRACELASSGGSGLGWRDVVALLVACGRHGVPAPLAENLAASALARLAGIDLPPGGATLGVALSATATAGGDLASGGVGRVVADEIAFASGMPWVLVSIAGAGGRHRLMVLPTDRAQATVSMNTAGEERARMVWQDATPLASGLLPGGVSVLLAGAAIRTAQIAGACARVLEMAARYAGDRVQFGRPIAKFQAIQQQLAIAGEWSAMAAMAAQLALSDESVALDAERVASGKQVAGTAAERCTAIAHAVHGAIGITAEYDLQLYTRRLLSWSREFGSSQYWATELGNGLLAGDSPRSWGHVIAVSSA